MIDALRRGWISRNAAATRRAGRLLAAELPENCTLCLGGAPGAGKTTFVKGLAEGWDISDDICSPTFNLYFHYRGARTLVHLDAYRLKSPGEAEDLLLEEFLTPPYCLVIEWPDHVPAAWLEQAWHLDIAPAGEDADSRHLHLRPGFA